MYLRSFTGVTYLPFDNRWQKGDIYTVSTEKDADGGDLRVNLNRSYMDEETTSATAKALKKRYESGKDMSAKALMEIKNIAADLSGFFPYYVDEEDSDALQFMSYRQTFGLEYYPWLADPGPVEADADGGESSGKDVVLSEKMYLSVPEENINAVDSFIREAGLSQYRLSDTQSAGARLSGDDTADRAGASEIGDDTADRAEASESGDDTADRAGASESGSVKKIIQALGAYYQEHIPYTYQPGVTPRGEDFINYFLTSNKKGYCAHFAAASTLILRRLGVRARYIEGYAIDPVDLIEDGKVRGDLKLADYYDGDNPLNTSDTSVVTVNVTDANAHAWVEVLVDGHWRVAELTPWSDEEPPEGSFIDRLIDFFAGTDVTGGSGGDDTGVTGSASAGLDAIGRVLGYGFLALFALAAAVFTVYILYRLIRRRLIYIRSDRSDRLVMDFHRASKKAGKKEKTINYRDRIRSMRQAGHLTLDEKESEELLSILERAGFSGQEISGEDYQKAKEMLKRRE